ncbi:MAG: hypothetical protein WA717_10370 [Methyloceanibacter sp.]
MSCLADWDDGRPQHYILNFLYWRWLATTAFATVWAQRASPVEERWQVPRLGLIELKVSQTTFAEMIGTTSRGWVSFMNKFWKLGFIDFSGGLSVRLEVHSELLSMVLHETPGITKDRARERSAHEQF